LKFIPSLATSLKYGFLHHAHALVELLSWKGRPSAHSHFWNAEELSYQVIAGKIAVFLQPTKHGGAGDVDSNSTLLPSNSPTIRKIQRQVGESFTIIAAAV
jgi:hypothetical protein